MGIRRLAQLGAKTAAARSGEVGLGVSSPPPQDLPCSPWASGMRDPTSDEGPHLAGLLLSQEMQPWRL